MYEEGGYPRRTFTLSVAASAVAELAADKGATLTSVAQRCQCHRLTARRWVHWVGQLCEPVTLVQGCIRLDSLGLPPPALPPPAQQQQQQQPKNSMIFQAGLLLLLLDHLARLLRDRGVALEAGPGLTAILRQQFERFRGVSWLTRASPPLRVEPGWAEA